MRNRNSIVLFAMVLLLHAATAHTADEVSFEKLGPPIYACACGCGVFDVATPAMLPDSPGGLLYLQFDFQDQNHNFHGSSRARSDNNDDKNIRSYFFTLGIQYQFNEKWGFEAELPLSHRHFEHRDGGIVSDVNWTTFGDSRIKAIYTGISKEMYGGITFGFKIPTGDHTHRGVDRDTQIGTGSTDLLLGGFYRRSFPRHFHWHYYAEAEVDVPVLIHDEYRPGVELNCGAGIYYTGWSLGKTQISPVAQMIYSFRSRDHGSNSDSPNSGYQRILLSPGIEFDRPPFMVYADIEFPIYQHVIGDQLVARMLFKVMAGWRF